MGGVDVGWKGHVRPIRDEGAAPFLELRVGLEVDTVSPRWRVGPEVFGMTDGDEGALGFRLRGSYVRPDTLTASLAVGTFTCARCAGLRDPRFLVRAQVDAHDFGLFVETRTTYFDASARLRPYGTEVTLLAGIATNIRYSHLPPLLLLGQTALVLLLWDLNRPLNWGH